MVRVLHSGVRVHSGLRVRTRVIKLICHSIADFANAKISQAPCFFDFDPVLYENALY